MNNFRFRSKITSGEYLFKRTMYGSSFYHVADRNGKRFYVCRCDAWITLQYRFYLAVQRPGKFSIKEKTRRNTKYSHKLINLYKSEQRYEATLK